MNEDKATRYHRLRRRTGLLVVGVWGLLLTGGLASGMSQVLANASAAAVGRTSVPEAIQRPAMVALYVGVLTLVGAVAVFPLTWQRDFVIERRFGRARFRVGEWLYRQAQTTAFHVVAWTGGAVALSQARDQWAVWWWLVAGLSFGMLMLVVTHVAPLITIPRLYRLRPIRRPELRERLEAFVRRVGVPVSAIHEWHVGADAPRPNAALVGLGPTLQVLLTDTLLADYSDDEIEVVLAHEIAHYIHGDVWKTLVFETATATLACGAAHWALLRVGTLVGVTGIAGFPIAVLAGGAVVLTMMPVANGISRRHERRADEWALAATKRPEALASGLRRLAQQSLAETQPSRVVEWLFYTHPPLAERLAAAREAMADAVNVD